MPDRPPRAPGDVFRLFTLNISEPSHTHALNLLSSRFQPFFFSLFHHCLLQVNRFVS